MGAIQRRRGVTVRNLRGSQRPAATLLGVILAVVSIVAGGCRGAATPKSASQGAASPAASPAPPHGGVDLKVLVVTDGNLAVEAVRQELASEGMPVTVINLHSSSRPKITSSFLARTPRGGNFDGVVLPSATPSGLSAAEMGALASYESTFSVRQVDAYVAPTASVGLGPPDYSGSIAGMQASVTSAATADGFGYLKGSFAFTKPTSGYPPYGYIARPLPGAAGAGFTPLLTATIPGTPTAGSLVGVYTQGRRQQLEIGFGASYYMRAFRYLAPGIVSWLTRGLHLGYWRNYLTIDYDDVFNADAQWSPTGHCTPGDSVCPPGTPMTPAIRMTPADVAFAVAWQHQHHFTMEFLYNGGPSSRFQVNGVDPLLAAFQPVASEFRWVNHTYGHANLGCAQDFTVNPWRCKTNSSGHFIWASTALINSQTFKNITWAKQNGIPADPHELATGEYSGLRILPQQPMDNPNLDKAMGPDKIKWVAMDASRELTMRHVGAALGVPRYPINVGYDVDTRAEEVSEYNWYYTSKADGGSGLCQRLKNTACIKPLSLQTGWDSYILPTQIENVMAKVLGNDPRPFFMHQTNLTVDRLGYAVMDGVLAAYRGVYAASAPVVNMPMSADGAALYAQTQWAKALRAGTVHAWVQGSTVTVIGPAGTRVPLTVAGTPRVGSAAGPVFGHAYAGERSTYATLGPGPLKLVLGSAPYPVSSPAASAAATQTASVSAAALPEGWPGAAVMTRRLRPAGGQVV
jgi:hypothetical protein